MADAWEYFRAAGTLLGSAAVAYVAGRAGSKREPTAEPAPPGVEPAGRQSRSAIAPRPLTVAEKVQLLWDERENRAAALAEETRKAAEAAAVKALRRLVTQAAGDHAPKPKEPTDGPPTDPDVPRP